MGDLCYFAPFAMEPVFSEIEARWKKKWEELHVNRVEEDSSKPKFYVLDMFPYPSGAGLHVGHPLGYVASDIYSRFMRMQGFNVLHPMGYDAFGLPAEQYAIETGTHPADTTEKAIKRYREQLDKMGFNYDWSRSVKTCDPDYYRWTQWIFLQLFNSWYNVESDQAESIDSLIGRFERSGCEAWNQFNPELHASFTAEEWTRFSAQRKQQILMHYRLAYLGLAEVNWCAALGTVLANDEVKDGRSVRGGHPVARKQMRQWFLRITAYADRLLKDLEGLDWSESMKEMQRNWIGRSEGAWIDFALKGSEEKKIRVFTTRPDTLFGATFLVLAPEHEWTESITTPAQKKDVSEYLTYVKSRSDIARQQEKAVTGAFTGAMAVHPITAEDIPVYIAEYVLAGYGTGAIMAVPDDDERDRRFAEKMGLPIIRVIDKGSDENAQIGDKSGVLINSGFLNGLQVPEAIKAMCHELSKRGAGSAKVNFRLRDAGFSRQRYWGEPIPVRYEVVGKPDSRFADDAEPDDIPYPLTEAELPLRLPPVSSFKPSGDGRSPLANSAEWVAKGYETDTMPGYAGSSWYYLRYMDARNEQAIASADKINYWQQVDVYFGGAEHAVGHLLYSRMWHKFLFDIKIVPTAEPFKKLVNQGMIQGRSNFIYRLDPNSEELLYPESLPRVYAGVEVFDSCSEAGSLDVFEEKLASLIPADLPKSVDAWKWTPLHVDISLVKDDLLDMDAFRLSGPGRDTARFLSNDAGQLRCGWEVEKMSKSKYNVVNPDEVIAKYGADCFRMFEMFLGPIEQAKPWDQKGIDGVSKFLRKVYRLFFEESGSPRTFVPGSATQADCKMVHKTIKKVEDDIRKLSFNTCISALMICTNELSASACSDPELLRSLALLMAPFAPFSAEEFWSAIGGQPSVHHQAFPKANEEYLTESSFQYPVSVNGKVRAQIVLAAGIAAAEAQEAALGMEVVQKWLEGKPVKKFIFVPGKIINIAV
jgi:leucyl-tRNA synthetase